MTNEEKVAMYLTPDKVLRSTDWEKVNTLADANGVVGVAHVLAELTKRLQQEALARGVKSPTEFVNEHPMVVLAMEVIRSRAVRMPAQDAVKVLRTKLYAQKNSQVGCKVSTTRK
jgi:hypothetical protein